MASKDERKLALRLPTVEHLGIYAGFPTMLAYEEGKPTSFYEGGLFMYTCWPQTRALRMRELLPDLITSWLEQHPGFVQRCEDRGWDPIEYGWGFIGFENTKAVHEIDLVLFSELGAILGVKLDL